MWPDFVSARRALIALPVALAAASCAPEGTGLGVNLVPEQQIQELGIEAWQALRAETPVSRNAQYKAVVQRVAERTLRAGGKNPGEWEVVVFADDQVNAFALPGKKIGVYEGMFRAAQDEAQLAAVIGHEIAHVDVGHSAERINTQVATDLGTQVLSRGLAAADLGPPELIAKVLGAGAQYGLVLPYSRNQELEADRLGLTYMARAGYDPRAAVALWQNMSRAGGGRPSTFLSTHPAPEARIAALQRLMPEAMSVYRAR